MLLFCCLLARLMKWSVILKGNVWMLRFSVSTLFFYEVSVIAENFLAEIEKKKNFQFTLWRLRFLSSNIVKFFDKNDSKINYLNFLKIFLTISLNAEIKYKFFSFVEPICDEKKNSIKRSKTEESEKNVKISLSPKSCWLSSLASCLYHSTHFLKIVF